MCRRCLKNYLSQRWLFQPVRNLLSQNAGTAGDGIAFVNPFPFACNYKNQAFVFGV